MSKESFLKKKSSLNYVVDKKELKLVGKAIERDFLDVRKIKVKMYYEKEFLGLYPLLSKKRKKNK